MTDPADQLDEDLGWPLPPDADETLPPPENADDANRMMRAVAHLRRKVKGYDDLRDGDIRRVTRWHIKVTKPLNGDIARLELAIVAWARAVHRANEREKTLRLPWGEVPIRARQRKVEVTGSQEDLTLLAKKHPGWVRPVKLEAALLPIKAAVVPGDLIGPATEAGYNAHMAVVPGDAEAGTEDEVVPGVIVLEPLPGADGKRIDVKPDLG